MENKRRLLVLKNTTLSKEKIIAHGRRIKVSLNDGKSYSGRLQIGRQIVKVGTQGIDVNDLSAVFVKNQTTIIIRNFFYGLAILTVFFAREMFVLGGSNNTSAFATIIIAIFSLSIIVALVVGGIGFLFLGVGTNSIRSGYRKEKGWSFYLVK